MGAGVGEAMLISAATGAATSGGMAALSGGDPLQAALTGGLLGGAGAGLGGALGGQAAGVPLTGMDNAMQAATQGVAGTGNAVAPGVETFAVGDGLGQTAGLTPEAIMSNPLANPTEIMSAQQASAGMPTGSVNPEVKLWDVFSPGDNPALADMGVGDRLGNYLVQNPVSVGMGASTLGGMFTGKKKDKKDGDDEYDGPLSKFSYDPDEFNPSFAEGGLAATPEAAMFGMGGGRLLEGYGDGMSDDIPAHIEGIQPAALSDGEFVIPADVVSGLGNGSTDAGARALYGLMDRVRQARTGRTQQGPEIDPEELFMGV